MKNYVVLFLFDEEGENVLLLLKNKPIYQVGKFNGVGGKIEESETPFNAIHRELYEETSYKDNSVPNMRLFATLNLQDGFMFCFSGFIMNKELKSINPAESEILKIFPVKELPKNIMPQVEWLIPMALSMTHGEQASKFQITESNE